MPIPVYIICAERASVDQRTGKASFTDVIEAFDVLRAEEANQGHAQSHRLRRNMSISVTACWMKDESDGNEVFECKIDCTHSSGQLLFQTQSDGALNFTFSKQFHRVNVINLPVPGFPLTGVYTIRASIRRSGTEDWQAVQKYPFLVRENVSSPAE